MAEPVDVAAQVQEHLQRWNEPATDHTLSSVVGLPAPEGDTRSTANHQGGSPLANPYTDDADGGALPEVPRDDEGNPEYDKMKNEDLERHLKARDLPVSGNKEEKVARLEEADESSDPDDES